jgi:hypothetical protein
VRNNCCSRRRSTGSDLEIRDFPKSLTEGAEDLQDIVVKALHNCVNLEACTWTRDGSLTTEIIQALQQCQWLEELQINGNSSGHYNPCQLWHFNSLMSITLIMPSGAVIRSMQTWLGDVEKQLKSLTLICKVTTFILDRSSLISSLASLLE